MSSLTINSTIKLNLSHPNSGVVVYAKQFDKDTRVIDIELLNGSQVWDPPAGCEMVVMYAKPDGTKGIYDVLEDNTTPAVTKTGTGKIQLTLAEQALSVAGNIFVEISFYTQKLRSTTLSFILAVESGIPKDEDLISESYFNILSELIQGLLGATTHPPTINSSNKNWMLWNEQAARYEDSGYSSLGTKGDTGSQGVGVTNIVKKSGTGAAGTKDTYALRLSNGSETSTFDVYNGQDGNAAPGSATPKVDSGTGIAGTANGFSHEDHQHPLNVSDDTPEGITSMASAGEATTYARSDHSHSYGDIINYFYPVGFIFLSMNAEFDPNVAYGGTWIRLENRFLVGAGDLYDVGDTGGEAEHLLTGEESGQKAVTIQSSGGHSHKILTKYQKVFAAGTNKDGYWGNGTGGSNTTMASTGSDGSHTHDIPASNAATAHNNMPPYLAVYMWQRTA